MLRFFPLAAAALIGTIACGQTMSPKAMDDLRSHFAKETDPIHKARLMVPLGDAEFQQIQSEAAEGNSSEALDLLKQYRDQVQECVKALDAKEPNPEKHPSGFKQLQISVRASLRRVDAVIVGLSGDEQKPFLELRKELEDLDRHLIRQLFPRQPTTGGEAPNPKS